MNPDRFRSKSVKTFLSMSLFATRHLRLVLTVYVVLWSAYLYGQTAKVSAVIDSWEQDASLTHASWSFTMLDASNGATLLEFDGARALPPASGMKAITTLVALHTLGPKYTWKTYLETNAAITGDSVLTGDLVIRGTGDPTLGSSRISGNLRLDSLVDEWADRLWDAGIRVINGHIVADQSWFDAYPVPRSWNYDDIGQYYGAGAYAVNCHENYYTLFYSTTSSSTRIDSVFPNGRGWDFINDVAVAGRYDNAYIFNAPGCNEFRVTGTIPANKQAYEVDGSIPDPGNVLADYLERALNKKGIMVLQKNGASPGKEKNILYTHVSPTLDSVIWHTNRKSINVYAETLVKTMGMELKGEGSYSAGVRVMRDWLQETGVDLGGLNLEDGSGLSRLNTVSSATMAGIMAYATKSKYADIYLESLSVSGESGTLKVVTRNTVGQGRILAKSGSMQKIRSYSGIVHAVSGKTYAFSIIVNQYGESSAAIRKRLEDLLVAMAAS